MLSCETFKAQLIHCNIHCNPVAIDYNALIWPDYKIAPPLEDVFPVLVTHEIIITNMEIQKLEILKQWKKW